MAKKINVVQKENEEEVPVEIIAQSIVEISKAIKKVDSTRLKRSALVTLIARKSKLSETNINIVLNNLDNLEEDWLKPVKKKK